MDLLQEKYLTQASGFLERFTKKDLGLYNCKCPFCGDSDVVTKTRGYIFDTNNGYRYYCHNCGTNYNFRNFLKNLSEQLFADYRKELFLAKGSRKAPENPYSLRKKEPIPEVNKHLSGLQKVSQLAPDHPCKRYVIGRLIPTTHHHRLYWCPEFKAWTNTMVPGKFDQDNLKYDEGRLVMPLMDEKGVMFGFTGRSINPDTRLRYIQIMLDEDKPKLYGLEKVNLNKRFFALEGGIDSLFLPNAIASAGGSIQAELNRIFFDRANCSILYDNEPRNAHVVRNMEKAVNAGYRLTFWPSYIREKDINSYILSEIEDKHIPTEKIQGVIEGLMAELISHTYSGLAALLKLKTWKKC